MPQYVQPLVDAVQKQNIPVELTQGTRMNQYLVLVDGKPIHIGDIYDFYYGGESAFSTIFDKIKKTQAR